jgi:hypothetical protein
MTKPQTLCLLVGSPRSGTTLATRLLLEIEGVAGPPVETHFFDLVVPWMQAQGNPHVDEHVAQLLLTQYAKSPLLDSVDLEVPSVVAEYAGMRGDSLEQLFRCVVHSLSPPGASVLLEKTTQHLWYWSLLRQSQDVRFVCLVRDPRAVVEATLRQGWASGASQAAYRWREEQREIDRLQRAMGPRARVFHYEDLVADVRAFRSSVAGFVGLSTPDRRELHSISAAELFPAGEQHLKQSALGPVDTTRVAAWLDRLDAVTVRLIESHCHREMRAHGYECVTQFRFTNPLLRWAGTRQARFDAAGARLSALSVTRSDRVSLHALLFKLRTKVSQRATATLYRTARCVVQPRRA